MRLLVTGGSGFIGTNVVEDALAHGDEVVNLDIATPRETAHGHVWRNVDIMDVDGTTRALREFRPTHLMHLAARTDTEDGPELHNYAVNTTGTANVLAAARECKSLERIIITSTQFVCRPGVEPRTDETYAPHTVYGYSKVITEQLTRHANLHATWTLVRPTTIWGPYSATHPTRMLSVMQRGLYVHPNRPACIRSYGFVGNVVAQLRAIASASIERVHGRVFYLGDRPIELKTWVDAFATRVTGKPARVAPLTTMKALARAGDVIGQIRGRPFIIQSRRLRSMIEDYPVPMEETFRVTGEGPYSLDEAAELTIDWLRTHSIPGA